MMNLVSPVRLLDIWVMGDLGKDEREPTPPPLWNTLVIFHMIDGSVFGDQISDDGYDCGDLIG